MVFDVRHQRWRRPNFYYYFLFLCVARVFVWVVDGDREIFDFIF